MLSRHRQGFMRVLWIVLVLLALPGVVYAANYVLSSGEFVGLGNTNGRIRFDENGAVDAISFIASNVGINLSGAPGQRLHLGDGNMLIEGGGETAIQMKRDISYTGISGLSQNPIFHTGRITQAGDGDPEFRFFYSDDNTPERSVLEFDRKGIVASVKTDRGSHFEGFLSTNDSEPVFRLNSYPKMRLEMGDGGASLVDVAIQRESAGTLTFLTEDVERARIDSAGLSVNAGLEVNGGYLTLDTSPGAPPTEDCNAANEVGRMKVDASSAIVYVCSAKGWGKITLRR